MQRGIKIFYVILIGQTISLLGSGLTNFGVGVWAYKQAGNVTDFSMIAVAGILPALIFGPFAGTLIDRWNRQVVLVLGQLGAALCTAALAVLFLTDQLQVWMIIIIVAISSVFGSFLKPAFSATITLLVPPESLGRANASLGLAMGLVQLLSPGIAGVLMHTYGMKAIFIIDLTTFVVGLFSLIVFRLPSHKRGEHVTEEKTGMFAEMAFAWRYLKSKKGLLMVIGINSVLFFNLGAIQVSILPMILGFATERELGLLQTCAGTGVILGSLFMIALGNFKEKTKVLLTCCTLIGIAITVAPMFQSVWLLGMGAFAVTSLFPVAAATSQTIWQRKVAPEMQGRVFSFRNTISSAMTPVAYFLAGHLADTYFEPNMVPGHFLYETFSPIYGEGEGRGVAVMASLFGFISFLMIVFAWLNPHVRNIDTRLPDYQIPTVETDSQKDTETGSSTIVS